MRIPKNELNEGLEKAKRIATQMVDSEIDPNDGCDQIMLLCETLDYPDDLMELYHLGHLQKGHEHLGFNKENLRDEIIAEAKKFISET